MTSGVTIHLDRFDAVIFDLDGVVTQTASVHAAAWKRLFDDFLRERSDRERTAFQPFDSEADYRLYVDGKPRYDGVRSFLESRDISLPYGDSSDRPKAHTICGLGNRKNQYFLDHLGTQGVEVFPSTVRLIRDLRDRGVKTAIFSASKNCVQVLEAAGATGLFDAKVDGVDADRLGLPGKPDPAVLLEAARRIGVEPGRAVIVEDAIAGVQAGRAGGFGLVLGVNRTKESGRLLEHGADVEVTDLVEVTLVGDHDADKSDPQALPSALAEGDALRQRMTGKRVAVFLDYDGTLTPIVERPEQAILSEEMRSTLERLASVCTVAIVSGRDLRDVRGHVRIENVYYAGSHGFDMVGPGGWHAEYDEGTKFLAVLDQAEADLQQPLSAFPGAWAERKRFAIAVHYRQAREEHAAGIEGAVDKVLAAHPELRKSGGKKVFELRPRIDWHKGKAVLWLLEALDLGGEDVLPLYVGDDVTDEDAFRALKGRGIGIVIPEAGRPSEADFSLRDTGEVQRFLEVLASLQESSADG